MVGVKVGAIAPVMAPEPERDRWGRYVVADADGVRQSYRRSTSVAHKLGDSQGLEHWGKTMIASGMGRSPELVKLAAAHPDPKLARSTYKELVEAAEELSGANAARRRGTALHALTEHLDLGAVLDCYGVDAPDGGMTTQWELTPQGGEPIPVDHDDAQRLIKYQAALEANGITILPEYAEVVLVLDSLRIAGTADRFGRLADGRLVVLDIKTGSLEYGHLEWAAQLAMYANHDARWVHVGGDEWERQPPIPEVDREWGVVIHLPATGEPDCTLHWLDLEAGFGGLIYASGLMEYRTLKVMAPFNMGVVPDRKAVALPEAPEWAPVEDEPLVAKLELVPPPEDRLTAAPEPVDLEAATYAWIVDRMTVLGERWEKGQVGPLNMLMQRWPSTVPQPLPEKLSPVQVEDMARQLDIIEREYELPLTPPRPGMVGKITRPKADPEAKPKGKPRAGTKKATTTTRRKPKETN